MDTSRQRVWSRVHCTGQVGACQVTVTVIGKLNEHHVLSTEEYVSDQECGRKETEQTSKEKSTLHRTG